MESLTNIYRDKENSKTGKLVKESQNGIFSPARTPLCDVRNKLPQDSYVYNIRKTLYGTPASSKRKTPSLSRSGGSKPVQPTSYSRESTPKRTVSMKQSSRRKSGLSDKKLKVVRFNLKEEIYGSPEQNSPDKTETGGDECHDEEKKLDKEIEGFISSILKLTVEEIRQENQALPQIKISPPTPSPVVTLHEDTPRTAEELAKHFNIEFKETGEKTPIQTTVMFSGELVADIEHPTVCGTGTTDISQADELSHIDDSVSTSLPTTVSSSPTNSEGQNITSSKSSNAVDTEERSVLSLTISPNGKSVTPTKNTCMKRKTVQCKSPNQTSPKQGLSVSIVSPTENHVRDNTVQDITDKTSSPVLSSADSVSIMVDTSVETGSCTPEKAEPMTQVNPDTMSTACSPFQLLTKDVEMMTVLLQTCDISMATENVDMVSQGVLVKPHCEDKMTGTDFSNTKSSETSMTPVKALSKNGKRLTAEEVRRQHPRAIANQLDTTLVCNERLKNDLKQAEKERDKLKCIVKDLRISLSAKHKLIEELESKQDSARTEMEEMHFTVVRDFQDKVEERDNQIITLETEVNNLKTLVLESEIAYENFKSTLESRCEDLQSKLDQQEKEHLEQVEELKSDFERNNYKAQFERSQQMIHELQAQLDEFADIIADMEVTEKLQGEVHTTISETHKKLRHAGVRNAEMRKKLITEYVSMQKMKKELMQDVENFKMENQNLKEECDSLAKSVAVSNDSNTQLHTLYASMSNDLLQATSQVCQLNLELAGARKALQDLLLTKELLVQHLSVQKDKEEASDQEIDSLNQQLDQLDSVLKEETKRKEDWERIAIDGRNLFEQKAEEYEQLVINLEHTLENRDHDIDILEKDLYECREIILEQRHTMDEMEKEYKCVRESAYKQQVDQTELQALRDNVEFLEAERNMLIDSLRDSEEKIRSTFLQVNQQQKTLCDTQLQFQQYQTTIHNLQKDLSCTREELDTTRSQARGLILKQDMEMKCSGEAVSALEEKMATILGVLKKKVGSEADDDQSNEQYSPSHISSESLVSKVLKAVNTSTTAVDTSYSWSKSRPRSQDASPSQEAAQSPSSAQGTSQDASSMDSGFSHSFASPGEASRSKLGYSQSSAFIPVKSKNKGESPTNRDEVQEEVPYVPLVEQIEVLSSLLSDIISKANILERASELSLQDLKGENGLLRNKVTQLEGEVCRLQQDRNMKTEELTEANQLIEDLKERIREMGDRIIALSDYQFEQKNIRQEVECLLGEVKRLEGEKDILLDQLNQSSQSKESQDQHVNVHVQHELFSLKKKNQQLFLQLNEERDRFQEMGSKAARKMKILEDNWKKAEAEVFRFDELVDSIQKILDDNKDYISKNPELLRLMRIINGEDTFNQSQHERTSLPKMPQF